MQKKRRRRKRKERKGKKESDTDYYIGWLSDPAVGTQGDSLTRVESAREGIVNVMVTFFT